MSEQVMDKAQTVPLCFHPVGKPDLANGDFSSANVKLDIDAESLPGQVVFGFEFEGRRFDFPVSVGKLLMEIAKRF